MANDDYDNAYADRMIRERFERSQGANLQREGGPVSRVERLDPEHERILLDAIARQFDVPLLRQLPTPASQYDGSVLEVATLHSLRDVSLGNDETGGVHTAPDSCKSCGKPKAEHTLGFEAYEVVEHDHGRSYSYQRTMINETLCINCIIMYAMRLAYVFPSFP